MTEHELFGRYFSGGSYALPFLLEFSHPEAGTIRLVNNTEAVEYGGKRYEAAGFEYTPPDTSGKGASLRISAADNGLIEFVENADERFRLDVVGVIAQGGEVQKVKQYAHFFGTVSWSETMELNFELGTDDRLDMTFPPYKFDTDMNRGNT